MSGVQAGLSQDGPTDQFISAAANRSSHVADWALIETSQSEKSFGNDTNTAASTSQDGSKSVTVLAYGSNRNIAVTYDLGEHPSNHTGIAELIHTPFTGPVTTLKFFDVPSRSSLALVAGSASGQAAIWVAVWDENACKDALLARPLSWRLATSLESPSASKGAVQAIGVQRRLPRDVKGKTGIANIAVGCSDGTVTIWKLKSDSLIVGEDCCAEIVQTLGTDKSELGGALPLDAAFTYLPSSSSQPSDDTQCTLLTTASTDRKINFWISGSEGVPFRKALTLSGHDDWVRSLDFSVPFVSSSEQGKTTAQGSHQISLASASQDGSVRLWRMRPQLLTAVDRRSNPSQSNEDAFDLLARQLEDEASQRNESIGQNALSNKMYPIETPFGVWTVTFDALLTGHESWVTGVRWHPPIFLSKSGQLDQPAALLSSSVDNSVILWTPTGVSSGTVAQSGRLTFPSLAASETTSALWLPSQRFGELGVAGAGALGMFGGLWSPRIASEGTFRQMILSHAWAGAVHVWAYNEQARIWDSIPAVTAHSLPTKSARWAPNGDWFLTSSLDRTARLYGQFSRMGLHGSTLRTWHELARPQTHGYDVVSAAWLDSLSFASAADEKVARLFAAPRAFIESAQSLGAISNRKSRNGSHNLLAVNLPDLHCIRHPEHLEQPILAATTETCSSKHQHLKIILCSPLFDSLEALESRSLETSFADLEGLLRFCYARAWSVAVAADALLADIDVLLVGEASSPKTLRRMALAEAGVDKFWAVKEKATMIPFLLAQRPGSSSSLNPEFLRGVAPKETSADTSSTTDPLKRHRAIALGGTFDHVHVGHKILLSMAALIATEKIIVGVTGDSMLAKKSNPHLLESVDERIGAVKSFLTTFRSTMTPLKQEVVELADVCGPAGSEEDLQALLVTDETVSGAETIAKTRAERNLGPLECYTIGVVGAGGETDVKGDAAELAAAKVGSTAIRKWLAKQSPLVQAKARRRKGMTGQRVAAEELLSSNRPMAASVPALGLSNRAVFEGRDPEVEVDELGRRVTSEASSSISSSLIRPPVEEELLVSTLWPEVEKLYGHGYELLAVDASPNDGGRFVATSCKSTSSEHSVVRVYDRDQNWKQVAALPGHSLTITRIRCSPNGKWICTVSRDRSWRLFVKTADSQNPTQYQFKPFASKESAHARIIWDVAWADDSVTFATGARDKAVKVWQITAPFKAPPKDMDKDAAEQQSESFSLAASISRLSEAVTALAFDVYNRLAVGMENGDVIIYQLERPVGDGEHSLGLLHTLKHHHALAVNEVAWKPYKGDDDDAEEEEEKGERKGGRSGGRGLLLSAGDDGAVRLTQIP